MSSADPGGNAGVVRIGTRASQLARIQAQTVADALQAVGVPAQLAPMTSEGDRSRASLASLGGTGVFAANLRRALLAGECDAVVHSLKDLPTQAHPGLRVASTPARVDARDALCARDNLTLDSLPPGAKVGTGSPRRAAQVRNHRPDLEVTDIRGNVDTRLRYVTDGTLDAVVLAAAGLQRLGRTGAVSEYLALDQWPTAPGQGVLAVEVREAPLGTGLAADLASIHDDIAWACAKAERGLLAQLEAGCSAPVAAQATVAAGQLRLHAAAYHPTESTCLETSGTGTPSDAEALGRRLGDELLDAGAGDWIAQIR
jgi:hydroxymethylbilane synthase